MTAEVGELVRIRAALNGAEAEWPDLGYGATAAQHQRRWADRSEAAAARLNGLAAEHLASARGYTELAQTYHATAARHREQAERITREADDMGEGSA